MSMLDPLAACAGRWRGKNILHDPHTGAPDEAPGTAAVTPVLNGRFVRLDYTWGYQGKPQEGTMLIGFEEDAKRVTAQWADTWHMSDKVMSCAGPATDGKALAAPTRRLQDRTGAGGSRSRRAPTPCAS